MRDIDDTFLDLIAEIYGHKVSKIKFIKLVENSPVMRWNNE